MTAVDIYNEYANQILTDKSISETMKSLYLSMLEITSITDEEEREEIEDEYYCFFENKKTKEKDKINLEINNMYNKILKLDFDKSILKDYTINDLEADLFAISYDLSTPISKTKIYKLKADVTKMQCQLGIPPKFLTVYQDVLKEVLQTKETEREIKKTFSK